MNPQPEVNASRCARKATQANRRIAARDLGRMAAGGFRDDGFATFVVWLSLTGHGRLASEDRKAHCRATAGGGGRDHRFAGDRSG
jgi:hypothetical protein